MTNIARRGSSLFSHQFDPFDVLFKNFFDRDSLFVPVLESSPKYPVDIIETDEGLEFQIATPGLTEKDIQISVNGNTLNVSYDKTETQEYEEAKYLQRGIAKRSFNFGWRIGNKYDIEKVEANMENGLLRIVIPGSPEASPKKIEIKTNNRLEA